MVARPSPTAHVPSLPEGKRGTPRLVTVPLSFGLFNTPFAQRCRSSQEKCWPPWSGNSAHSVVAHRRSFRFTRSHVVHAASWTSRGLGLASHRWSPQFQGRKLHPLVRHPLSPLPGSNASMFKRLMFANVSTQVEGSTRRSETGRGLRLSDQAHPLLRIRQGCLPRQALADDAVDRWPAAGHGAHARSS